MFDTILTAILTKFLGAYLDGLDAMNFRMSLGKVSLSLSCVYHASLSLARLA